MEGHGPQSREKSYLNGNNIKSIAELDFTQFIFPIIEEFFILLLNCRLKKMKMNTYMYAPKDDCKHRAFWRDLYSVEEAGK